MTVHRRRGGYEIPAEKQDRHVVVPVEEDETPLPQNDEDLGIKQHGSGWKAVEDNRWPLLFPP